MIIVSVLFILGLLMLYKGGDVFVNEAIYFARKLRMSELLIGTTIVSIGTTLPEVSVSALASADGLSGIAYGNAFGSVICNTALIAGILLLLIPTKINKSEITLSTLFFFIAVIVLLVFGVILGVIHILAGISLLCIYILYMFTAIRSSHKLTMVAPNAELSDKAEGSPLKHALLMALGAALIFIGSRLLINNGIQIAQTLGVPERVIALTFVSLGTSLPELVTAIVAIAKGHSAISLGNIIGASFMDLSVVIGVSSIIMPITIPPEILRTDIYFMLISMIILTAPTILRGQTSRYQGAFLLALYTWYCIMLFSGQYTSVFLQYLHH
jgi:cation:H+ antiporter